MSFCSILRTTMYPSLETDRLLLRPFTEDDFDDYAALCADPEVMRYAGECRPLSRGEAWRHMAMILGHWQLRGYGLWAIELKSEQKVIGRVGCFEPEGWPALEVGWMLARDCWGKGYASEATKAALNWVWSELHVSEVIHIIHPENLNSIKLAERVAAHLFEQGTFQGFETLIYKSLPQS